MARIVRAALAAGASLVALVGGAATAQAEQSTSYFTFQVEHSSKCLTIQGGSVADGKYAVQSTCVSGTDSQLFALKPVAGGQFQVQAKHSGRCLTTGPDLSWNVVQSWCADDATQKWRVSLVDVVNDRYELRPAGALDYCLSVPDNSTADGVRPFIGSCANLPAQRWRMTPATS